MMYILGILLAKYSEVNVSLKPPKPTAYTKLSTTKVWRFIQSLCPKSPSARGLVASLPVRLLFKSI